MAIQPRWLLWRYGDPLPSGKRPKIPYGTNNMRGVNEGTCSTFDAALALWNQTPDAFSGLGYAPTIDDQYACLDFDDLDHAARNTLAIWNDLKRNSYCEFSPSRKGAHAIVTLSPDAKQRLKGIRNIMPGIELYSDSGWFTVTGQASVIVLSSTIAI